MLYEGEISLHFDPPTRHSHRTRSPLLWAVIRIFYLGTATIYCTFAHLRGVARILGKGVLEYARKARAQNFKPRPLLIVKVKVQIVKENAF